METVKPKQTQKISEILSIRNVAAMCKGDSFESSENLMEKLFPHLI